MVLFSTALLGPSPPALEAHYLSAVHTSKYRVEYRLRSELNWTVDSDAVTETNHTVDDLVCDSLYQFRVNAYGSGTVYATAWSDGTLLLESTAECMSPVFEESEYTFELAEDASVTDAVGTVSATHPDDDTIEYTIESGNTGNAFIIGINSGAITVNGALDFETIPSYTLTVQAEDDDEDTDTVTVTITVTDVAEDPPTAPAGLTATLDAGTFTLTWDELAGAAKYEAQHKTDEADSEWTALPETTTLTQTYTPAGGEECGTTYQFRVRAFGDGETYTEMWGMEFGEATVETAACNVAPVFDPTSFTFNVAEDAEVDAEVGTVSATDEDTNDALTYTIESGNTGSAFAIGSGTGAITVAGPLDYETTSSYTLTIKGHRQSPHHGGHRHCHSDHQRHRRGGGPAARTHGSGRDTNRRYLHHHLDCDEWGGQLRGAVPDGRNHWHVDRRRHKYNHDPRLQSHGRSRLQHHLRLQGEGPRGRGDLCGRLGT